MLKFKSLFAVFLSCLLVKPVVMNSYGSDYDYWEEMNYDDNCANWGEEYLPYFNKPIYYDWQDLSALYNCVQHEVGIYSQRSKYIVASSIINRYLDGWEDSIYDVITAENQYQDIFDVLWLDNYANQDTIDCVNWVLYSGIDYSNGATSFYNRSICGYISWFEDQELVAELDGHRYFRQWE